MEIGFNNDVIYRGATFHIQTEDHGIVDQRVSSQLFYRGAILDTRTISYASLIAGADEEERKSKIRKVMVKSHRSLYKRLFGGEYDTALGDEVASEDDMDVEMVAPEDFQPEQQRVPEVAKVVEEDGKVTFTFDHGDQIDLEALSRQLSQIDIYGDGDRGGFGGGGPGEFDNLFAEFGATPGPSAPVRPPMAQAAGPATAPVAAPVPVRQVGNIPPERDTFRVTFRTTGQRAFQGLIEPEPSMRAVDLVREHLSRRT